MSEPDTAAPPVTIAVPAYNEEGAIADTVNALSARYPQYEILVVDDGSSDSTGEILKSLPCRTVTHRRNRGYGAGWKTGCREACGDLVVYYDGDGQFDVEDVARLLAHHLETGADMTSGARQRASHTPLVRQPGKFFLKHLANHLSRTKIADLNCGLRVFDRKLLADYLHLLPDGFSASTTSMLVFLKRKHQVEFLPIVTKKRLGTSSVRLGRDGVGAILLIIRMVALFDPLWVFLPIAAVLMSLGGVYGFFSAVTSGQGIPVLASTMFMTGLLIFFMGIVCDQISALRLERLVPTK